MRGEDYRSARRRLSLSRRFSSGFAFDPFGMTHSSSSSAGGSTMGCLLRPGGPDAPKLRTGKVRPVDELCEQDGLRIPRLMVSERHQDPHMAGLLYRFLAREDAQFPMNDPPAREGRTPIAPGDEIDVQCIRKLAFVHEPWREPCPYLAVGPRNRQQGSRLGMPLDSSDPGVTSP